MKLYVISALFSASFLRLNVDFNLFDSERKSGVGIFWLKIFYGVHHLGGKEEEKKNSYLNRNL